MDDVKALEYMRRAAAGLRLASRRVTELEAAAREPIAIIGMACRYPGGVTTPEQLWELVASGTDAVTAFPVDRGWDMAAVYRDETSSTRPTEGGFLDDAGGFDAGFFDIAPRQALMQDPRQRLLLEITWEAFERADIVPASIRNAAVGVYVGASGHDYLPQMQLVPELTEGYLLLGDGTAWLSGMLAYHFGLHGPAFTLDTACSSSLVALHQACVALRLGECVMALAGGASVMVTPILFSESSVQRALSSDGRCKAYAKSADGTGWGEGAGVLLLERLSDARRQGHNVLAVIRGSAVNSDGASGRLTAPHGPSQEQVINQALSAAGLTPGDVDAVEGHGTGTALGDPIEVAALIAAYGVAHSRQDPLWLGSVKSNIAHTQAASGIAGVIKMVKAMEHGILPPTIGVDEPSPYIDWSAGTVRLLTGPVDWAARGHPRRAGVSSFGGSGTNAHILLEEPGAFEDPGEYRHAGRAATGLPAEDTAMPWVMSARSEVALRAQAGRLREFVALGGDQATDLQGGGWTLATRRTAFEHRAVVVGGDRERLDAALAALAQGEPSAGMVTGVARSEPGRVAFVFPGQGSQWAGMGAQLLDSSPVFAEQMARCEEALAPWQDWQVSAVLRQAPGAPTLDRLDVVQPALFSVMVSLAALWRGYGVEPDAVVGHSQGEVAAAYVAGALSLADAAKVVASRSKVLMAASGGGAMLAIALSAAEVSRALGRFGESVSIAVLNGPAAVTVGGTAAAIAELAAELTARGARVRPIRGATGAGHTPIVEAIREDVMAALGTITPQRGRIAFYSTVTGDEVDTRELDTGYWYRNIRHTVLFEPAVRRMLKDGYGVFVESSAHPVLASSVQDIADEADAQVVTAPTLRREEGSQGRFLLSAAGLWANGIAVDWAQAFGEDARRNIDLPTYPFQHRSYWLSTAGTGTGNVPAPWTGLAGNLPPDQPPTSPSSLAERLAPLSDAEQDQVLVDLVRAQAAAIAGHCSGQEIGAADLFLELGFDSLLATQLRNRLADATGLRLPSGLAFECPSPIAVARELRTLFAQARPQAVGPSGDTLVWLYQHACDNGMATQAMTMLEYAARLRPSFTAPAEVAAPPAPVRLADGTAVPVLICITPYLVSVGAYQYVRFAAPFRGRRPVWVLSHPGFGPGEPVPDSMEALLAQHAQAALACADGAPIVLFGHSAGGWAAHGVAAQLESAGRAPAGVVMADSFRWNPQDDSVIFNAWMRRYSRPAEAPVVTAGELIAAGRYKRLFDEWEPPPVRAPILLLRSADTSLLDPIGGIEMVGLPQHVDTVIQVPGDHFTMMQDHAATAADAVENWLMRQVRGEP